MDRMYKKADVVNVYASANAKNKGDAPLRQEKRVPYSAHGFENYKVGGRVLPGYRDDKDGADACVFLE